MDDLDAIRQDALKRIDAASDLDALEALRVALWAATAPSPR